MAKANRSPDVDDEDGRCIWLLPKCRLPTEGGILVFLP